MKESKYDSSGNKKVQQFGAFIMIPFALAVPPIVGWLIGTWLDVLFETTPWLRYLLLVFGFISGVREVYRIIKRYGDGN